MLDIIRRFLIHREDPKQDQIEELQENNRRDFIKTFRRPDDLMLQMLMLDRTAIAKARVTMDRRHDQERGGALMHSRPLNSKALREINEILKDFCMGDVTLKDLLFETLHFMRTSKFSDYPSVNVITKNDGRDIWISSNEKQCRQYEYYANISLEKHTLNVLREFRHHTRTRTEIMHPEQELILGFACLFHDFGKNLELCEILGIDTDGIKSGKTKHEELSVIVFHKIIDKVDRDVGLFNDYPRSKYVKEISHAISTHHHKPYAETKMSSIGKMLIEIDRKARAGELERREGDTDAKKQD